MVAPLLTAIRMRLGVVTLIITRNQRWLIRSQTTRGSEVVLALRTEVKNVFVLAFRPPSVPLLSKTLMRPLRKTTIWVGLTSPIVSGGMKPDSLSCAPRKLRPTGWGERGA